MTFAALGASLVSLFGGATAAGAGGALATGAGTIGEGLLAASPILGEGLAAGSTLGAGLGTGMGTVAANLGTLGGTVGQGVVEGSSVLGGVGAPLAEQLGSGTAAGIVQAPPMPVQSAPIAQAPPPMPNAVAPQPSYLSKLGTQLTDPSRMADQLVKMPGMLTQKLLGGGSQAPLQFAPPPPAQPMGARMAAPAPMGGVVDVAPQGGPAGLSLDQIIQLRRMGLM